MDARQWHAEPLQGGDRRADERGGPGHVGVVAAGSVQELGQDVRHAVHGPGWVQGSGVGRVTVRFEEPDSEPGRVRTFFVDDPDLEPADPLPLVRDGPTGAAAGA